MTNPYAGLDDRQFWRRAISRVEAFNVDPVTAPGFRIAAADLVATAGSCFAQHISRSLAGIGFNYYVPEALADGDAAEAARRNFGVFSCRYGNLYTARQLLQLFQEAFGERRPEEGAWRRPDGRFVDPFRPQIEPDGFATEEEVAAARAAHLQHVRRMFETTDVFIFTLGLTEGWRSRRDGAVFPLAPGVVGGSYTQARHEFVNFTVHEVEQDLQTFMLALRRVNRGCRVVLTVSPVPLIATYEPRHVLVSTTYSKSVLRVAAEGITQTFRDVDYFPSYEIITGNYNRGAYYEDDLREVNAIGVAHAMRIFLRHYPADLEAAAERPAATMPVVPAHVESAERQQAGIVCDEEAIDQIRG
jgi:hypothetical protein